MCGGDCDAAFAREKDDGFGSVAEWRAAHERFWRSYTDAIRAALADPDWDVGDDTTCATERFRFVARLEVRHHIVEPNQPAFDSPSTWT